MSLYIACCLCMHLGIALKGLRMSDIVRRKKFTFYAVVQQQRPLHTAEKHRPTMFHKATVKPTRSGPSILYNTPLMYEIHHPC